MISLPTGTAPLQGCRRDHRLRSVKRRTMRRRSAPSLMFLGLRCCGGKATARITFSSDGGSGKKKKKTRFWLKKKKKKGVERSNGVVRSRRKRVGEDLVFA
ncbi:hypothetical protein RchiOBHm_Chr2g0099721 [Rosa chinensis]|uniref:Uncharacterized protein n=1 Tax=Rosa chinensis TaxID=74649 RepID=A0A2P6RLY7_ROSCH|nr:hypothetical protein RchiOBHm_Chr2g0099721 [Rosa chinensis]